MTLTVSEQNEQLQIAILQEHRLHLHSIQFIKDHTLTSLRYIFVPSHGDLKG